MQSRLNPYIHFKDNTKEAMEFYHGIFGGKLDLNTFGETPMPGMDPSENDKIMHSMLEAENGITFMAADTPNHMEYKPGNSVSMSLSGDNDEELSEYFTKLSEGGMVAMPLSEAPWGDKFGMLVDKYGIEWFVNITKAGSHPDA